MSFTLQSLLDRSLALSLFLFLCGTLAHAQGGIGDSLLGPTAPTNLTATASGPVQVNLSWTAATETGGTITNYLIERCAGVNCGNTPSNFAQVGTSAMTTFSDTGLTGSTSYSYRVRAKDATNVTGPYSNIATATTAAPTFTAPTNLTATAAGSAQITLSWTAATETGGTISQYLIERCAGANCSNTPTNFAQVGTSTTTTFNDTGLTASTGYSYRVRATDAANNLGPYSNIAPVPPPSLSTLSLTQGPVGASITITGSNFGTTPGSVTFNGTPATSTAWSATSIDVAVPAGATTGNVLVTVGGMPSNGLPFTVTPPPNISSISPTSGPVGTVVTINGSNFGPTVGTRASGVSFNGVVARTTSWGDTQIVVPVPAGATSGNVVVSVGGVASNGVAFTVTSTAANITFVQSNSADPQAPQTTVTVPYTLAQTAGNLNVVVVGWNDSTAKVNAVTDTKGSVYALVGVPVVQSGTATQAIYYAKNIAAAAAGANIVTVTFTVAAAYPDIRIAEYSGLDPVNPLDVSVGAQGNSATSDSGPVTTTNANDLLVGANLVQTLTSGAGTGYTSRVITSPDGDILEDRVVTATGSYNATAAVSAGAWIMQMVAFKAAGSSPPPPISVSVSPTTANVPAGAGTQNFTATVANDAQSKGVTWSLSGAGCSGTACGSFTNVTATAATYNAPAAVPNPSTVTVTATSVADNTQAATATVTITPGTLSVTVSPKRGSITTSQTQQFTATVFNDPNNAGVTWQVDRNIGGNSTSGTISTSGLFTPGAQAGLHTITATSVTNASVSASVSFAVTDLAGVLTYHYDSARTGQNLQEYALTPANVNSSTFGALFSCPVDGYLYAAPLYVANLNVAGQKHNVVIIATEHDSVYAFDADSPSCTQLWSRSFLGTGVTTVSEVDSGEINDPNLVPEDGVTSTPVIDSSTNSLYVLPHTKETVGSGCSTSTPCFFHRLHVLDLTTGNEKFGGPVVISPTGFNPLKQLQRPALLLNNGTVYVGFGGYPDMRPYEGWLMAFDATTLALKFAWMSTANGNNQGSIWQAGAGPAVDANGNVYVETANGVFDGTSNFADSVVKLSSAGSVLDYFTPFNQALLQANDIDLASGGPMILPDSAGSATNPHLMTAQGKPGILYLLDQTNLGKYHTTGDQVVQEVTVGANTTNVDGGFFGKPAYWNGNIYTAMTGDNLRQFKISNGSISTPSNSNSANAFPFRGATPTVSASGTTNGIVWLVDVTAYATNGAAILDAYDATNVSTLLFSSPASGSGAGPVSSKFTVPTVANGKVYVVGQYAFTVFGLLPN